MLPPPRSPAPIIKRLGRVEYEPTWRAMQAHNKARTADTPDEIWLLEHAPVFTLGLAGMPEHVLAPGAIPVVAIDRGGQVTYHGPGQLVVYLLLDLRRWGGGVKALVNRIEQSMIDLLAEYSVCGFRQTGMPGVYVTRQDVVAKIAAVGLRVANHASFHGLSLNVDMDLAPFSRINPCGYPGLAVTQLRDLGVPDTMATIGERLLAHLQTQLFTLPRPEKPHG